jgi:hypothetical protein
MVFLSSRSGNDFIPVFVGLQNYSKDMKKVQRMLNFHTYKRLFCANCNVIAKSKAELLHMKFSPSST